MAFHELTVLIVYEKIRRIECCQLQVLLGFYLTNSADDKLIFFLFSQKRGLDISCKLSPVDLHEMSEPLF